MVRSVLRVGKYGSQDSRTAGECGSARSPAATRSPGGSRQIKGTRMSRVLRSYQNAGRISVRCISIVVTLAACACVPPPPVIPAGPYVPGQSYFSPNNYIEYIAGNAPVILSAPHGGSLTPSEIATRTCGTNTTDLNTQELVRQMQVSFFNHTGRYPHVVINRLSRSKLDANRDLQEATCGDEIATASWLAWLGFLDVAKQAVTANGGKGWYMDMHGHGHAIQRLELGYNLSGANLGLSDAALDASTAFEDSSSIRTISRDDLSQSFSGLLRGATSLGTMYAAEGFRSVPSTADPSPGSNPYFNGGFNIERYGCSDGETLCSVQIETNLAGVRDSAANRTRFADATARILEQYLAAHWGVRLKY
jgi:hypothetical protein